MVTMLGGWMSESEVDERWLLFSISFQLMIG